MKKIILLLSIFTITFSSCTKEEIDHRDKYLGTWNTEQTGSATLYQNGQSIGTIPYNESSTNEVTKSGISDIVIGGENFTVDESGKILNKFKDFSETKDGINLVATEIYTGTATENLIVLNVSVTGSWSSSNGAAGNMSGNNTITLTR